MGGRIKRKGETFVDARLVDHTFLVPEYLSHVVGLSKKTCVKFSHSKNTPRASFFEARIKQDLAIFFQSFDLNFYNECNYNQHAVRIFNESARTRDFIFL